MRRHDPDAHRRRRAGRPVPFDPQATFEKFEDEVHAFRACVPHADLYLFPELYLTGEHSFTRRPAGYDGALPQEIPAR